MAQRVIDGIDRLNRAVAAVVMWLAVAMVLVQFANVVLRYVFAVGFIGLQQSVVYMHALLFMLGAGYALAVDAHVRIDIFYRGASPRRKALVDLAGAVLFLLPVAVATFWLSLGYVASSWRILEGSTERSGLPFVFALKTAIWLFAGLLGLQGLALALRAASALRSRDAAYSAAALPPPGRAAAP